MSIWDFAPKYATHYGESTSEDGYPCWVEAYYWKENNGEWKGVRVEGGASFSPSWHLDWADRLKSLEARPSC